MRQLLLPVGLAVLLAACGTKGPLVLPQPKSPAPAVQPASSDDSNKAKAGAAP